MKTLIAALTLILLTLPAHAQGFGGGRGQHHGKRQKAETPKPKVDEKAYGAALKYLPDKKFDPWHGVR